MSHTTLTKYAPLMAEPDPAGAHRAAKKLWHEKGIVVVFPEQMKAMGGLERQLFEAIANKQYGGRK